MRSKNVIRVALRRFGLDVFRHRSLANRVGFVVQRVDRSGPVKEFLGERGAIGATFEVPIDICTSFLAIPYSRDDWNPLVATLKEYDADRQLRYVESSLGRLHAAFTPSTLADLFFAGQFSGSAGVLATPSVNRTLFRYVWDVSPAVFSSMDSAQRSRNYYFGPMDAVGGEAEFHRLVSVFESIEKSGYQASMSSPVSGYFIADERSCRFVVGSGNHRVAALSALGRDSVPVRLHSHAAVVHRAQLESWTLPRGGPFTDEVAMRLFDVFLRGRGSDRAVHLGLV